MFGTQDLLLGATFFKIYISARQVKLLFNKCEVSSLCFHNFFRLDKTKVAFLALCKNLCQMLKIISGLKDLK